MCDFLLRCTLPVYPGASSGTSRVIGRRSQGSRPWIRISTKRSTVTVRPALDFTR
jgi:hypothetical protein